MTIGSHTFEHAPPGGGVDVTFNPITLIVVAVVGYVAYRVFEARRRGEPAGAAAGKALAESAPPAIAAVVGIVVLSLALAMLAILFFVALFAFVFTAPFAMFASVFTGEEPDHTFGPIDGLPGELYFMLFLGLLLVLGAMVWVTVATLRRMRAPRTATVAPAPRSHRERPLRAPGR